MSPRVGSDPLHRAVRAGLRAAHVGLDAGVAVREEMVDDDEDGVDDEEHEEPRCEKGTAPRDVFIVDGEQPRVLRAPAALTT